MRLEKFRVANFRNINDSGWVEVAGTTALVGRNESGKTNLLEALRTLSGPFAGESLSLTRDFPADRMRSEYSDDLEVVRTRWLLSDEERSELAALLPGATRVSAVEVWRGYPSARHVAFCGLEQVAVPISSGAKELVAQLAEKAKSEANSGDRAWAEALGRLEAAIARETDDIGSWHQEVSHALGSVEEAGRASGLSLVTGIRETIDQIAELIAQTGEASGSEAVAAEWVLRQLPPFLYVDEYPDIDGHMDLRALDRRRREGLSEPSDLHFETLLRMAGIDTATLGEILDGEPEVRRQIVGRAGAGLTRKLRALWTDRALKVRFNLDGDHLQTLVCDPTSIVDIEVNLNQRSRGFRWFFAFFIMLTASRQDPESRDAILLLDEPGLQLHAAGQRDLLRHLTEQIDNQSILATQSPFMIPSGDAAAVRTVSFDEEQGTTVSDDPAVRDQDLDSHTPASEAVIAEQSTEPEPSAPPAAVASATDDGSALLRAATGQLVEALFGSERVLVVEHLTDYWYLSAISAHFAETGLEALPEGLVPIPAGGAILLPHLMRLLGEGLANRILLLTSRPLETLPASPGNPESRLAPGPVFIGEGFPRPPSQPVELEDLFDANVYDRFVRVAYSEQLKDKHLETDDSIPCAVKRYEEAFAAIGLRFSRSKPARFASSRSRRNMNAILSEGGSARFLRLFQAIRARFDAA
jgi:hypothetical protein